MKNNKKIDPYQHKNYWPIVFIIFFVVALTFFCRIVGYSLIIPLLLFMLGLHLQFSKKGTLKLFLDLGLILILVIFTTNIVLQYTELSPYYIPVAGVAMLTMLLFNDLQLSFVMAFIGSVLVSLITGGGINMMLIFFLGGLTGSFSVREARTRGHLISAGLFVSFIQVICLFLLHHNPQLIIAQGFGVDKLYPLAVNGFITAFLVIAPLKVFEILFGVMTNFSLLELADSNHPLLRRMALEAPGTWQHSLTVSQLSEAAADSIGANALLTRAGAYYHDIGKLIKPEYFTENQLRGDNKHDRIEPSMSRLVILNHVKEGVELGKKHKLNKKILDFIPQHHGTGLMYYFYQKALEETGNGETVSEIDFRYPGPKPQTKETAITLLADSVEGATRALDEPVPTNIEETVKKVVNNKFIDGQLDECNLTLKEIDKISATFTRILSAMYHGRVKYPEKKNGNNSQKFAEQNKAKPSNDHQDRQDSSPS